MAKAPFGQPAATMSDFMYELSSLVIAAILFLSMIVSIELGYRIGLTVHRRATEASRVHVNAIQASLLGVLALLLGFAFSLALQRFDSRSEAVVQEANAIGTAYLRAQLLPESAKPEMLRLLRGYLDSRIRAGEVAVVKHGEREALAREANALQLALWEQTALALREDDRPATSGLFIQALNEMIDSYGRRQAVLERHVPELVLLLLYGTFILTGAIVGYAAGMAGHRTSLASYLMVVLIVLLVFIIVDLDRPRRGLIEVKQTALRDLQASIRPGK